MNDSGANRNGGDVSPISENSSPVAGRSPPLRPSRYSSNLPVPRKNLKKFWKLPNTSSPDQESSTVRWDEYSGEPTDSEKGKPPSTTPGAVKSHEDPSPGSLNKNYGTSTHISGGTVPARKRVGSREISDAPIIMRPEWKGAGGRHRIVTPMFDKKDAQIPRLPPGRLRQQREQEERERVQQEQRDKERAEQERRDMESSEQERREMEQEQEALAKQARERAEQEERERQREAQQQQARERLERAREEHERAQQEESESKHDPNKAIPALPSKTTMQRWAPEPSVQGETHGVQQPRPFAGGAFSGPATPSAPQPDTAARQASLTPEDTRSPLARNPSNEEIKDRRNHALPSLPERESSKDTVSTIKETTPISKEPNLITKAAIPMTRADYEKATPPQQYPTRDSSMIEARFRADIHNMHFENEPPSRFSATTMATTNYDSPPRTPEMTSSEYSSPNGTPQSILNRKRPVAPSGMPKTVPSRKPTPSEVPTSSPIYGAGSDSKSLPKPPPDVEVIDPVKTLQAKQDVLRRRRYNLETVIHELTNVVQPASIAYDQPSRQEIKKTVEGLKKELSEVVKDEHETGLKLHRAWKRHDDFAQYEPTSIWVRRVTS